MVLVIQFYIWPFPSMAGGIGAGVVPLSSIAHSMGASSGSIFLN